MVHRWAAANLRGEPNHDPAASQAEGRAAARLLNRYADGVAAPVDTVAIDPVLAADGIDELLTGSSPVARAGCTPPSSCI
jgi:hypothetical protein